VFGMDPTTTIAYYNDRFKLCALLPCVAELISKISCGLRW